MRYLKLFLLLLMMFQLEIINAQLETTETTKTEKQTTEKQHTLEGKASYYGSQYKETRKTASGQNFNKEAYTAAHKTLPFGTVVRVVNKKNGKSVNVVINDRGPFVPGRVIDVSPIAARDLEMTKAGVIQCELEIISMPEPKKRNS